MILFSTIAHVERRDEQVAPYRNDRDGTISQCASLLFDLCLSLPYLVKMIYCTSFTTYYLISYIFQ